MNQPLPTAHDRRSRMQHFLGTAGWGDADIRPLAGDASFRRYERVTHGGRQAVLMDAPPEHEDVRPFMQVDAYLLAKGFSAPEILAADEASGFLLLEDLGDDSYTRLLGGLQGEALADTERELYLAATDVLVALHRQSKERDASLEVPPYGLKPLLAETDLFADWFLPAVMPNRNISSLQGEFKAIWEALWQANPLQNHVPVLRDYHADNLLWLPGRKGVKRVGLLDFQDALIGHGAYDLVSLLEDARRDVLPDTVDGCLQYYLQETGVNRKEFEAAYALLGAQRNAKIIGIFVRLGVRDGKPHYTKYLPRVWRHFEHDLQHPLLQPMREWLDLHIKPQWRGAISLPAGDA